MKSLYICCVLLLSSINLYAQGVLSNASKLAAGSGDLIVDRDGLMHALIRTEPGFSDSLFFSHGIVVNSKFGNIWSVQFPPEKLTALAGIPGAGYIELATRSNATRLKNDLERQSTKADKVQNGTQNGLPLDYSGKDVVVGIVDIGFQCDHPTFFTSDGARTRIRRYWLQNTSAGLPPSGFSYGTEIRDTTIIQIANDMDGSHGTHVAGIAAGSGFSSPGLQYRGVAPGADLVFVSIKYSNDTLGGSALGDYLVANSTILDAFSYIFNYAASVGKPAVINLSWGMHTGPHDGTSLFDKAVENLTGQGRIIVGANGNEGENPMHFYHKFSQDTVGTIMIENGRQFRKGENVYADFWGSAGTNFSMQIQIIDTNKNVMAETPFISSLSDLSYNYSFPFDSSLAKVSIVCESKSPLNDKPNITVNASHNNQQRLLIVARLCSDTSEVHGWNSGSARQWTQGSFRNKVNQVNYENKFIAGNSDYTAGENGGTSKAIVSVGAYAARSAYLNVRGKWVNDSGYVTPGNLAPFSSRGPTVDGRIKPDVTAPGYHVPSSINNRQVASWMMNETLLKTVFRNDTNYWAAFNGTSMASPHVAGIVALMLEANPSLDAAQVKQILTTTAVSDQFTGTVPNMRYGYGKVDALAAVAKAIQFAGINSNFTEQGLNVYPNPAGSDCHITLPDRLDNPRLRIISIDGRAVLDTRAGLQPSGTYVINNGVLAPGMYIIRLDNGKRQSIAKFIKL